MIEQLLKNAQRLEKILKPWKGMTFVEAKKHGWSKKEEEAQQELWGIGNRITIEENKLNKILNKGVL